MEHAARDWRPQAFGRAAARTIRDPLIEPGWDGTRVLVHVADGRPLQVIDVNGTDVTGRCAPIVGALATGVLATDAVLDGYLTFQATRDVVSTIPDPDVPQGLGGHMARFMLGGAADLLTGDRRDRIPTARGEHPVEQGAPTARRDRGPGDRSPEGGVRDEGADGDAVGPLAFVTTDLLAVDGTVLLDVPLLERKRLLDGVLAENLLVRLTPFVREPAGTFIISWRAAGFDELAYKDPNSRYTPGVPNNGWALAPMPRR